MSDNTHQNKEFFNKEAAHYENRNEKTINELIGKLREKLDFIGVEWVNEEDDEDDEVPDRTPVRLLDYACGTGLVSRALAPYTTECVGIDLSENMVEAYNAQARKLSLPPSQMCAHVGNLLDPADPAPHVFAGPDFFDFDLAAVGLGFHHFEDPVFAAGRLVERLRPGGVLLIVDFAPHEHLPADHGAAKTVAHRGFSPERVREIFENAGAGEGFKLEDIGVMVMGKEGSSGSFGRRVFFARGEKI